MFGDRYRYTQTRREKDNKRQTDRQETCLIQLGVFRYVGPHESEGGKGEGVDEEKSFVRMLSELGVHALLVDAYINERKREL